MALAKRTELGRGGPAWGEPEFMDDVEQGSDDWFALRLGLPTASCMAMIVRDADADTRKSYMRMLAGEILTGRPGEGKIETAAMARGKMMEPLIRDAYARRNLVDVEPVGFVRRLLPSGRYVGASPDGRVGKSKGLEIKSMAPHRLVALVSGSSVPSMPPEHRWQVFGTMLVTGWDSVDLTIGYDRMPVQPTFTIARHEQTIKEIADAVEVFDHELSQIVKRIRAMG